MDDDVTTMRTGTARHALPLLAAAGGAVLVLVATPLPAEAKAPVVRDGDSFAGSFAEPDFCGMPAQISFSGTYRDVVRPVPGSTEAFYLHNSYTVNETIVVGDTTFTTSRRGRFIEQHATLVRGSVYRFDFQEAGTFVLRSADGTVLLRETGVFKGSVNFDTAVLPDGSPSVGEPGGSEVPGTFLERGRHGRTFTEEEFCAAIEAELG